MKKFQLEHIIRAVGSITDAQKMIVIGSQAIHGQFPDITNKYLQSQQTKVHTAVYVSLLGSMEADIFIPENTKQTAIADALIGYMSNFHDTHGYYMDGVDKTTAKLPEGWEKRLFALQNENTNYVCGQCLEIHDLIISKLYARRDKDMEFLQAAITLNIVSKITLLDRLENTFDISFDILKYMKYNIDKAFNL
jgi:hypothetical protein